MIEVNTSVSHGTMRTQDLISRFIAVLDKLDAREGSLAAQYIPSSAQENEFDTWWGSEDALGMLDELLMTLNDYSPEGFYFGAHPGDGSDYGFWAIEPESEELETAGQALLSMI